jgi:hypothetical protein
MRKSVLFSVFLATVCSAAVSAQNNTLTNREKEEGWSLLFWRRTSSCRRLTGGYENGAFQGNNCRAAWFSSQKVPVRRWRFHSLSGISCAPAHPSKNTPLRVNSAPLRVNSAWLRVNSAPQKLNSARRRLNSASQKLNSASLRVNSESRRVNSERRRVNPER